MALVELGLTEVAQQVTATGTLAVALFTRLVVPRGCKGTLIAINGSVANLSQQSDTAILRLIPDVFAPLSVPYALLIRHTGYEFVGTPADQFMQASIAPLDHIWSVQGRGTSMTVKGARSNNVRGWAFTTQTVGGLTMILRIDCVFEYILEWIDSGPTPPWKEDQDEELSIGEG